MDRQDFETKLIDWLDRPEAPEDLTSDLDERHELQAWRHLTHQVRQNLQLHEPPASVDQAILRAARQQAEQYAAPPKTNWISWFLQSWQPIATFATLTIMVGMTYVLSQKNLSQHAPALQTSRDFKAAPSAPMVPQTGQANAPTDPTHDKDGSSLQQTLSPESKTVEESSVKVSGNKKAEGGDTKKRLATQGKLLEDAPSRGGGAPPPAARSAPELPLQRPEQENGVPRAPMAAPVRRKRARRMRPTKRIRKRLAWGTRSSRGGRGGRYKTKTRRKRRPKAKTRSLRRFFSRLFSSSKKHANSREKVQDDALARKDIEQPKTTAQPGDAELAKEARRPKKRSAARSRRKMAKHTRQQEGPVASKSALPLPSAPVPPPPKKPVAEKKERIEKRAMEPDPSPAKPVVLPPKQVQNLGWKKKGDIPNFELGSNDPTEKDKLDGKDKKEQRGLASIYALLKQKKDQEAFSASQKLLKEARPSLRPALRKALLTYAKNNKHDAFYKQLSQWKLAR
ncbi:MAG: hypothetical protein H6728_02335 [Myxococcales bacterium]|nr:hypothetical protein [Myxococcales bacterium]